jgi:hypothetical protein
MSGELINNELCSAQVGTEVCECKFSLFHQVTEAESASKTLWFLKLQTMDNVFLLILATTYNFVYKSFWDIKAEMCSIGSSKA